MGIPPTAPAVATLFLLLVTAVTGAPARAGESPAAAPAPADLAAHIDAVLEQHWKSLQLKPTDTVDDATFLRRLCLDLCGTVPTRGEVEAFLDDRSEDRRARKIEEYLADRASAQHFASQWSRLLLESAPRGPENAFLEPWLEQAFADATPFSTMVREMLAGQGRDDENGATSFVLSYRKDTESLTAVTARAFLGVQLQCAQCHDHPYEKWTQEDFRATASFFQGARSQTVDAEASPTVYRLYDVAPADYDRDLLGKLTTYLRRHQDPEGSEGPAGALAMLRRRRTLTDSQWQRLIQQVPEPLQAVVQEYRERLERYGDPEFLTGEDYRPKPDTTPREALADWVVAPGNPYFARAVVNRVWQQMFGRALVEPVDDLLAEEDAVLPALLEEIAAAFRASGTSMQYLLGTLARTRAYALAPREESAGAERRTAERHYAAHPVRPLGATAVLQALLRATRSDVLIKRKYRGKDFEDMQKKLLDKFRYVFQDDEGGEATSFDAGIPQALFLMNSKMTNEAIDVESCEVLQEILRESRNDARRLEQMFLATVNRPPTSAERGRLLKLLRGSPSGYQAGIADVYWALLNSSEFLTNH